MKTVHDVPVISRANHASAELLNAFHNLIPQLTEKFTPITIEELNIIISSQATTIFTADIGGAGIVGLCTLVTFRIPTCTKAWIEDLVGM